MLPRAAPARPPEEYTRLAGPRLRSATATELAPGPRLAKHLLVPLQDAVPVRSSRHDFKIFDQEADDRLDRDATGREVELVKCQRLAITVGMHMGPVNLIA
jgi:hypothetical protein